MIETDEEEKRGAEEEGFEDEIILYALGAVLSQEDLSGSRSELNAFPGKRIYFRVPIPPPEFL